MKFSLLMYTKKKNTSILLQKGKFFHISRNIFIFFFLYFNFLLIYKFFHFIFIKLFHVQTEKIKKKKNSIKFYNKNIFMEGNIFFFQYIGMPRRGLGDTWCLAGVAIGCGAVVIVEIQTTVVVVVVRDLV